MSDTLFSLLQSAADRHPKRVAVDFAGVIITYAELIDRAERVAGFLRDRGVRPGMHVAFCFRKSIDAIIALFGAIRTGAAYVPLDPAWPAPRIAGICEDASIRHWLGTHPPPEGVGGIDLALATEADEPRGGSHVVAFEIALKFGPDDRRAAMSNR